MNWSQRDSELIWHPFTQMKTSGKAIAITRAEGVWLFDEDGNKYLDAISSWWVNLHGHGNMHIATKIAEQAKELEQVIFAGFTHPKAIELAEQLLPVLPGKPSKLFFSDDGSTAVEVALKMAIQFHGNSGKKRTSILAFENAYHGDTFGAMSVSARSVFTNAFGEHLFDVDTIPVPVKGKEKESLDVLEKLLREKEYAAFIFEPLVQGSAGMIMYEPEALNQLMTLCRNKEIILIADEVFTGFGRTGKRFACDYLTGQPDIVCVSKGLTGGFLPMGITACAAFIYEAFLSDEKQKALFHGHSYTANALACAAACASLDLLNEECFDRIAKINRLHENFVAEVKSHPRIENARYLGTILALEIKSGDQTGYFNSIRDEMYTHFIKKGLVLRPLGNVLYVVPPYCISEEELNLIYSEIRSYLN